MIFDRINNVLLVFLIVNLSTSLVYSQTTYGSFYQWSVNSHYYVKGTTTADVGIYDAINYCAALQNPSAPSLKGYLATITSLEEWQYMISIGMTSTSSWFSGTDLDVLGSWVYSTGPEIGTPLYSLFHDLCYNFCTFGAIEPNLLTGEHYLHTSNDGTNTYWNNNNMNATNLRSFLCEYGGLGDPFLEAAPTTGDNITVINLTGYDIPSLVLTFTSKSDSTVLKCTSITQVNSTAAICQVPAGTGKYKVTFSDKNSKTSSLDWQYRAPYISSVYPKFNAGEVISVTGTGFGTDASKVVISLTAGNIACNSVTILKPDEALSCTLSASITAKFLPITISVNTQGYTSYKTAFFYSGSNLFYSGFVSASNFNLTQNGYAALLRLDGYSSSMAFIGDSSFYNFIYKTLPVPFGSGLWNIWQPIEYSASSFVLIDGPKSGTTVSPYSTAAIDLTGATVDTRFWFNLTTGALAQQAATSTGSTLVQYGGQSPIFINTTTPSISTAGATVPIQINNYGTVFSTIVVNYYYQTSTTPISLTYGRDYINSVLNANIPSGYNGPYSITVTVDGYSTTNSLSIDYSPPTITSITKPSTLGGTVTFQGSNYYSLLSIVSVSGLVCSNLQIVTSHTTLSCTVGAGSGTIGTTITVGAKTSQSYTFQYANPIVTSVTNVSPLGGLIEISGSNFFTDPSLITVSLGTFGNCQNIQIVTDHTKLSCTAPAGYLNQPVKVTVNTLVSNTDISLYYDSPTISSVTQNQDSISIQGSNFGQNLNGLAVKIGSVDITQNCLTGSSDTSLTCTSLPLTVVSDQITITGSNSIPSYSISLVPYLISLSSTSIPTSGSTITLNGRFFESNIQVTMDNVSITSSKLSNQQLVLTVPSGTGVDHSITASNNNGSLASKETLLFSYQAPTITTTSQSQKTIVVTGTNFGTDSNKISISIGSSIISSFEISTPHTEITFGLPDSLQNAQLSITVDSQSITHTFKLLPYLTELSPLPSVEGDTITVSGYYLSQTNQTGDSTNPSITLNGQNGNCIYLTGPSPYSYECTIAPGFGIINIIATVDSIQSPTFQSYYASPIVTSVTQVEDYIELIGNEFGEDFNGLAVRIGTIDITSTCVSNNTFGTCKNLPLTVASGQVTLTGSNAEPNPIDFQFKPYLYSLTPQVVDTIGQEITISGRYFEQISQINIVDSGSSFVPTSVVDNTTIIYNTVPNTGVNHPIQVEVGTSARSSNLLFYSNEKPIINSITHNNDYLEIAGQYFGDSLSSVIISLDNNVKISPSSVNQSTIIISTPSANGNLTVNVSSQISNSQSYQLIPVIESVSSVGVNGGIVTIGGKYLSNIDINSNSIGLQYSVIKNAQEQTINCNYTPTNGICTIPAITGLFSIQAKYSNIESNEFPTQVESPSVSYSSSSKRSVTSKISITGTNFASQGLQVTLSNSSVNSICSQPVVDSSGLIECSFSGDIQTEFENGFELPLTIKVQVDGLEGSADVFNYLSTSKVCDSSCVSPYGNCVEGTCICNSKYTGPNCQTSKDDTKPTKPDTSDNGTTTLPGNDESFKFNIAITHLRELSLSGAIIKTLPTSEISWDSPLVLENSKTYHKGTFSNDPAVVELYLTYYEESSSVQFAGETIEMPDQSVKYEIHVSQWSFNSSLNHLQVIYLSTAPSTADYDCVTEETKTSVDSSSESIGWFQFKNGNSVMNAKFSSKMIVDGRILNSKVQLIDSKDVLYQENQPVDQLQLFVTMNSPSFTDKVILDPNFSSLLLTSDEVDTTGCTTTKKWKIPLIAVLCSVGGATAIAIGGIFGYRKYKQKKFENSFSTSLRKIAK